MRKYLACLTIVVFCLLCINRESITVVTKENLLINNSKILATPEYVAVSRLEEDVEHPIKKLYEYNESFDLSNNYVKVIYEDESIEVIPLNTEGVTVFGFNSTSLGEKTVTISYGGKSIEITVVVKYTPVITISPSASGVVYNLEKHFKARVTSTDACLGVLTAVSQNPENVMVTEGESTSITNENLDVDITIKYKGLGYGSGNIIAINFEPNDKSKCNSAEEMQFTVSVSRISQTVTLTERTGMQYTGKPMEANPAETTGNGEITYTYYRGTSCSGTELESAPIDVGMYRVKATASQTNQYNSATSSCIQHKISKSDTTIVLDDFEVTYSGNAVPVNNAIAKLNSDDSVIENADFTYEYYSSIDCSGSALTELPINVGTYSVKAYMEGTSNYNESESSCALYTISPYTPVIDLEPKVKEYDGSELIANIASVTLTNNEVFNGTISYTYYNGTNCSGTPLLTAPIEIGAYSVKASTEAFGNYSAASKCVLHTITKMSATISFENNNVDLIYRESGSNIYTYNGDGDVTCMSSNTAYVTCSVSESENKIIVNSIRKTVNPIEITVSASEGENYKEADDNSFTVTVLAFTPIINLNAKQSTYTGSKIIANRATVTLTNNETFEGTINYTYYNGTDCSGTALSSAPINAGEYSVKASITANGNYNASNKCVFHTITKSNTITNMSAMEIPYTGSPRVASGAKSKLASTNTAITNGEYTYTYYSKTDCSGTALSSAPINVGYYGVIATLKETSNYKSSSSACVQFRIYNPVPIFKLTGLVKDSENKIFKNIKVGTKVKELFNTTINNEHVEIYSKDDTLIYSKTVKNEKALLSTGMYIKFFEKIDTLATYKISVSGDVSGDGEITPLDYVKIKNNIMGTAMIEGKEYIQAADYNDDGEITPLDYVKVKNYIMNGGI